MVPHAALQEGGGVASEALLMPGRGSAWLARARRGRGARAGAAGALGRAGVELAVQLDAGAGTAAGVGTAAPAARGGVGSGAEALAAGGEAGVGAGAGAGVGAGLGALAGVEAVAVVDEAVALVLLRLPEEGLLHVVGHLELWCLPVAVEHKQVDHGHRRAVHAGDLKVVRIQDAPGLEQGVPRLPPPWVLGRRAVEQSCSGRHARLLEDVAETPSKHLADVAEGLVLLLLLLHEDVSVVLEVADALRRHKALQVSCRVHPQLVREPVVGGGAD
mmetsp:Transcript_67295/g.217234  ORF Transcript_67295/g.217234 Transcript_67295/m.217234 type:complete len:274 (+) Transcript_67295:1180-2001(+)